MYKTLKIDTYQLPNLESCLSSSKVIRSTKQKFFLKQK